MKHDKTIEQQRRIRKIKIAVKATAIAVIALLILLWIFTSLGIYLGQIAGNI